MSPETKSLITSLLKTHGIKDVTAMMQRCISGETITHNQVKLIRKKMIQAGASKQPRYNVSKHNTRDRTRPASVLAARRPNVLTDSELLLRRQLVAGQHFITDPSRFAAVCASVGLAA